MRVFMTGATGYIGSAVAAALRERGHEVAALVRPESDGGSLRDRGVVIVAGDLGTVPSLGEQLSEYDTLLHLAQSRSDTAPLDRGVIDTFLAQKAHVIYTSGVWVLGDSGDDVLDETSPVNPLALVAWRPAHEELVLHHGGAVIRPGCVYGGKQSLLANWFAAADRAKNDGSPNGPTINLVGDGKNRWAFVDLHELADCYVRIVEQRATGILHAIDDTRAPLEQCARAVAPDVLLETISIEAAREKFGPFADALAIDQQVTSHSTRQKLGWQPERTFTSSVDEQWAEWSAAQQ